MPKAKKLSPRILGNDAVDFLPPHEPTTVPGFHAYSHRWSVAAGETLDLRASSETPGPVRIQIVRHRDHTSRAELLHDLGEFPASPQPIHRGSYVHIAHPIQLRESFSAEIWYRQLAESPIAGLMIHPAFSLSLEGATPCILLHTSNGEFAARGKPLALKQWHHAVLTYDGKTAALFVDGIPVASAACTGKPRSEERPLRLGALENGNGQAAFFFHWRPLRSRALPPRALDPGSRRSTCHKSKQTRGGLHRTLGL